MIVSVVIIAVFGIHNVGGLTEVWNRAVDGDRIFSPEYVKMILVLPNQEIMLKNIENFIEAKSKKFLIQLQ